MQRLTALRGGLALARRAVGVQLSPMRPMGSCKAVRTLCAAGPLPHQRGEVLPGTQPSRSLASGRTLPRAAAVDAPTAAQALGNGGVAAAAAGTAPTFQEAISRLQEYWASVGCALWLPHNTEVSRERSDDAGGSVCWPHGTLQRQLLLHGQPSTSRQCGSRSDALPVARRSSPAPLVDARGACVALRMQQCMSLCSLLATTMPVVLSPLPRCPFFRPPTQLAQPVLSCCLPSVTCCCPRQVGAGTMNPATFLRVLGPEPWNVAYAEPSIRPDDSRYGDNPNRVQRHTQFQAGAARHSGAARPVAGAWVLGSAEGTRGRLSATRWAHPAPALPTLAQIQPHCLPVPNRGWTCGKAVLVAGPRLAWVLCPVARHAAASGSGAPTTPHPNPPPPRPTRSVPETVAATRPARPRFALAGHSEARPWQPPGAVPGVAGGAGHRHACARRAFRGGQLGVASAGRLGPWLGGAQPGRGGAGRRSCSGAAAQGREAGLAGRCAAGPAAGYLGAARREAASRRAAGVRLLPALAGGGALWRVGRAPLPIRPRRRSVCPPIA